MLGINCINVMQLLTSSADWKMIHTQVTANFLVINMFSLDISNFFCTKYCLAVNVKDHICLSNVPSYPQSPN